MKTIICECGRYLVPKDDQDTCPVHGVPNNTRTVTLGQARDSNTRDAEDSRQ